MRAGSDGIGEQRVKDASRDWRPDISGFRATRRPAVRALNSLAEAQRRYAMRCLDRWPVPNPGPPIDLHLSTVACERYAPMLMRMIGSFIERAGEPSSLTVVSDGSMTPTTIAAVRRLWPATDVIEADELLAALPAEHPVACAAQRSPYVVKLAWICDTAAAAMPPLYQHHPALGGDGGHPYDDRMIEGEKILAKVNSGVVLRHRPLDWERALAILGRFADDPHPLAEQTATALALTDSGARHFDPDDFILSASDLNRPWDAYRRSDAVLRHYATASLKRKLLVRATPGGLRTLPAALAAYPFSRP